MAYDINKMIPAIYHEDFTKKFTQVNRDTVTFFNALSIHNINSVLTKDFNIDVDEDNTAEVNYMLTATTGESEPVDGMIKLNHVFVTEDSSEGYVWTICGRQVRVELLETIQLLLACIKNKDASATYGVINQLSMDTKNVIVENVATVRIKPDEAGIITPWQI
jgi:polynucleotide 5'-kinase involved in rRNA processing